MKRNALPRIGKVRRSERAGYGGEFWSITTSSTPRQIGLTTNRRYILVGLTDGQFERVAKFAKAREAVRSSGPLQ
jgi:hypothetical protein